MGCSTAEIHPQPEAGILRKTGNFTKRPSAAYRTLGKVTAGKRRPSPCEPLWLLLLRVWSQASCQLTEKAQHFPGGRRKVLHHAPQPPRLPSAEDTLVIVDSGSGRENTGAFSGLLFIRVYRTVCFSTSARQGSRVYLISHSGKKKTSGILA